MAAGPAVASIGAVGRGLEVRDPLLRVGEEGRRKKGNEEKGNGEGGCEGREEGGCEGRERGERERGR